MKLTVWKITGGLQKVLIISLEQKNSLVLLWVLKYVQCLYSHWLSSILICSIIVLLQFLHLAIDRPITILCRLRIFLFNLFIYLSLIGIFVILQNFDLSIQLRLKRKIQTFVQKVVLNKNQAFTKVSKIRLNSQETTTRIQIFSKFKGGEVSWFLLRNGLFSWWTYILSWYFVF